MTQAQTHATSHALAINGMLSCRQNAPQHGPDDHRPDRRPSTAWLRDPEFSCVKVEMPLGWTYRNGNPLPRGRRLEAAMSEPIGYDDFRLRLANSVTSVQMP